LSGQNKGQTEYSNHSLTENGFSTTRKGSDDASINIVQRRKIASGGEDNSQNTDNDLYQKDNKKADWKKIFLLIVAITVHNIPGKDIKELEYRQYWYGKQQQEFHSLLQCFEK
jgi:hypothetical protein